ncbi:hypothetical protein JL720_6195 [Aureococcus anophagefferens]|nr:hypothetical protein JL720_6195 [Aureococcus anophagefferens]
MADPSGAEAEIDGEEKRIRFQAPKKRFAALAAAPRATSQHDTVALVEGEEGYRLALDGDAGGAVDPRRACLLRSELLRLSQLEKRKDFLKLVHEPLWPLAQSLPEVLHNGDRIATVLGAAFADPATRVAGAYSLASVLARDAGPAPGAEALAALVAGLAASVGDRSPPVAKAASDALGYVFRYCADGLLEGAEAGWPAAAPLLALFGRRVLAKHLRKLLSVALRDRDERAPSSPDRAAVSRLLFELAVGVGGRLHSRAGDVLGVVLARGGAVADRVLTLLLDATRRATTSNRCGRPSSTARRTARPRATRPSATRWRASPPSCPGARALLTNRDDDLKVDRALPRALARDRCDRLAALLDGLVAGAGAGAAPRDAGALVRAALAGAAAAPQGALRAVAAARGEAWVAGVLQAGGARDALAVLDALDDLEDAGAGVDAAADAALEALAAALAAPPRASPSARGEAGLRPVARPRRRGDRRAAFGGRGAGRGRAARADVATLAGAAAGPRVAALAAQLVDACSRRAFESEKTAELRVVRAAGLRALDALGQPTSRAAAPLIAALTGRPAALGSAATLRRASSAAAAAPSKKRRGGEPDAADLAGALAAVAATTLPRRRPRERRLGSGRRRRFGRGPVARRGLGRGRGLRRRRRRVRGARAVELFVHVPRVDLFDDGGDPDAKEILPLLPRACGDRYGRAAPLPGAARHRRLETLLRVFAGAAAPKSLPHGDALRAVYERLLGKPRGDVASLALKCLAPYKVPHLAPYAARVAALLDDATLRDTLVKLGASREARGVGAVEAGAGGWQIDDTHRAGLIPVLCRVLFGRFRAKSAAVGGGAKRAAAARRS